MKDQTPEDVCKLARQKFGRELTDSEAKFLVSRLSALAEAADLVVAWQTRLGETAPAMNFSVPNEVRNDRG